MSYAIASLVLLLCLLVDVQAIGPIFNYSDQVSWAANPAWTCNGSVYMRQTPINIITNNVVPSRGLINLVLTGFNQSLSGNWTNNGHGIRFNPNVTDHGITVRTHLGLYDWAQFHFHWGPDDTVGSEQTVDGRSFSGEIHHVNFKRGGTRSDQDFINVLSVLLVSDNTIPVTGAWQELLDNVRNESQGVASVTGIPPSVFMPQNTSYYYYPGSQTSPPCNEIVHWFVMQNTLRIPAAFLERLRVIQDFYGNPTIRNYRDTQPIYNRQVMVRSTDGAASRMGSSLGLLFLMMVAAIFL
ncbi:carbonic anhydrase 2-like [Dysidea avara]|uniref:carbonic anhydrase 2-like n=1 Tax=Dysidea avara TaxID=196820 RepID=UPI00331ABC0C